MEHTLVSGSQPSSAILCLMKNKMPKYGAAYRESVNNLKLQSVIISKTGNFHALQLIRIAQNRQTIACAIHQGTNGTNTKGHISMPYHIVLTSDDGVAWQ